MKNKTLNKIFYREEGSIRKIWVFLIVIFLLFLVAISQAQSIEARILNSETSEALSKTVLISLKNPWTFPDKIGKTDQAYILRTLSKQEFSFDDIVINEKIPNKLKHILVQTDNVLDIGFMDAAIKASWIHQYGLHAGKKFWAYNGFYGRANAALQGLSALEYSINQSDNFLEFVRFLLAQTAISSIGEHLGYWIYVNSSVPINKHGELIGWRGKSYPNNPNSNNDVGWMHETPAGWSSRLFFNDPKGTVRKEAVFASIPILYAFAYLMTPNKEFVKPNKLTKFKYVVYFDGIDYNRTTGLLGGTKLGLKYEVPKKILGYKPSVTFYSSYDLNARADLLIEKGIVSYTMTFGSDNQGNRGIYGASITMNYPKTHFSISYRKRSDVELFANVGRKF